MDFARGQVHMVAGPASSGKTAFALVSALKMRVPTLYYSADSDANTMRIRSVAALTKHPQSLVKEVLSAGMFNEEYGQLLESLPIRFQFDPTDPTVEDIVYAMTCRKEIMGVYPTLLVLDNLMNITGDGGDEWQAMRRASKDLHYLARKTEAAIVVLHHTSVPKNEDEIEQAPKRSQIQGKVDQMPEVIVTIAHEPATSSLWVATVKNRHRASDLMARFPFRMYVDYSRMQITDDCTQRSYDNG
ncbi:AAA family ATPase [Longispora urticae]